MNTHPSAVLLQAYEDGEVGARRRSVVRSHVESCVQCRDRLESLRGLSRGFSRAVARLDASGEAALARLAAAAPDASRATPARTAAPVRDRTWLRAAVFVGLLVGAGSLAAVSSGWLRDRLASDDAATATTAAVPETRTVASGFTVTPTAGALRIELTGLAADSRVELRLVDGAQVSVDVSRADDTPVRFSDAVAGRIDVAVNGRAEVTVSLPRGLAGATLLVDGVVRATKRNARIDVSPAAEGVTVQVVEG